MKAKLFMMVAAVCCTMAATAKDIKTVVLNTAPEMQCANCENKIKSNIRFEKGVKDIVTDLKAKTVTVKYDADKTNVDNIIAGFAKIDYKATVAGQPAKGCCGEKKEGSCCGAKKEGCCQKVANAEKKVGSCCQKVADAEKKAGSCCQKAQDGQKTSECCGKQKSNCCK